MLSKDWEVHLNHTLREGNQCVDYLAKMGARGISSLVLLEKAPTGMDSMLLADAMGVVFVRHQVLVFLLSLFSFVTKKKRLTWWLE